MKADSRLTDDMIKYIFLKFHRYYLWTKASAFIHTEIKLYSTEPGRL